MNIAIILSSIAVVVCILLIRRRKKVIIKKPLPLKPGNLSHWGRGVFVLQNQSFRLIFLKNMELRIFYRERQVSVYLNQKITRYFINKNSMSIVTANYKIHITSAGVKIESAGEAEFGFRYTRPNFMYNFNQSNVTFTLGDRPEILGISLIGFKGVRVTRAGANEFEFLSTFDGKANIRWQGGAISVPDEKEFRHVTKKYFGIYDTSRWEYVPKFNSAKVNILEYNHIKNLLRSENKIISLPEVPLAVTKNPKINNKAIGYTYINLSELGFSRLVLLKFAGKSLKIVDILQKISYILTFNCRVEWALKNYFGKLYLFLRSGCGDEFQVKIKPLGGVLSTAELETELCVSTLRGPPTPQKADILSIFDRMNALILHGYFVNIPKLIQQINIQFLPEQTKISLANLLASFIFVFNRREVLKNKKAKMLLVGGIAWAMSEKSAPACCFLKKVLFLIQDKKLYNRVLTQILDIQSVVSGSDYEYFLTEILGVRIQGNSIFIRPKKNIEARARLIIKDKQFNLTIGANWQTARIDELKLVNIDSFDITSLLSNTNLTYE